MKTSKNKGSVLLTFLIIMLVVVVAGSAYYFGTKKTEAPVVNNIEEEINETNLPTNEEIENVVDDSEKPVPTPVTPSITVLSPNGGENIVLGHSYTIKWKTTGFTSNDIIDINIKNGSIYCPPPESGMTGCQNNFFVISTKNTGSYVWDTGQKIYGSSTGPAPLTMESGDKYKINLTARTSDYKKSASDMSNNVFSINIPAGCITTIGITLEDQYNNLKCDYSLKYSTYSSAVNAFKTATDLKMGIDRISFYVPGKFPREDGDPYFIGKGIIDMNANDCITGYMNLVTGAIESHHDVCVIVG